MKFTAETIAGFLGGDIVGDKDATVWSLAKIEEGQPGAISFLSNPKYEKYIYDTDSSIVIVNRSFEPQHPVKTTMVRVDDAYACFAKLLELYAASKPQKTGISPKASIAEGATVGEGCYVGEFAVIEAGASVGEGSKIYPQSYVGDRVKIGKNATIYAGVKIYEDCVIGDNVTLHSGAVIGADGFGFAPQPDGTYSKIPQLGNVVIEDDVEIGANTCIDRATMGSTFVRRGVKLDNLIQIAHNVSVGENTVCAAQVGIAGSTKVGKNNMYGGQVGIVGHLTIGDRVQLASKAGVLSSVGDDMTQMGYPSLPGLQYHRSFAVFRNLPEMKAKLEKLAKEVDKLIEDKEAFK